MQHAVDLLQSQSLIARHLYMYGYHTFRLL